MAGLRLFGTVANLGSGWSLPYPICRAVKIVGMEGRIITGFLLFARIAAVGIRAVRGVLKSISNGESAGSVVIPVADVRSTCH